MVSVLSEIETNLRLGNILKSKGPQNVGLFRLIETKSVASRGMLFLSPSSISTSLRV